MAQVPAWVSAPFVVVDICWERESSSIPNPPP